MDLGLTGRTAVVTGASRGIGAATARMLEDEGARVLAVSRSDGIDVTALDAAERISQRLGGAPDILVNNAGTSFARPLDELTEEDWQSQWELHVMASMRLMRAFAPKMAEHGWGRIVNVTSSAGKRPSLTNAAYSVTKAAQSSLSRVFADTYGAKGVLVNSVAPGPVHPSCGWTRAGSPTRPPARAGSRARSRSSCRRQRRRLGASARRRRSRPSSSSSAASERPTSPAPTGRSTAARLQPSSEAETIAPMPPAARVGDMHTCPMVTGVVRHVGGPILRPGRRPC